MTAAAELKRMLWQEVTPARLVGIPIALAVGGALALSLPTQFARVSLPDIAFGGFFITALLWGGRAAGASVLREVTERTWDGQRLSALSPAQIALGKLAGAAAMPWYAALPCLVFYAYAAGWVAHPWSGPIVTALVVYVGGGLLCQALCLLFILNAVRKQRPFGPVRPYLARVFAIGTAATPIVLYSMLADAPRGSLALAWYGLPLRPDVALAALLWGGWAFAALGVERVIRAELRGPAPPWAWLAFVAVALAAAYGLDVHSRFVIDPELRLGRLIPPVGALLVYGVAIAEPKSANELRRLRTALGAGALGEAAALAPRTLLTLAVVLAVGAWATWAAPAAPVHIRMGLGPPLALFAPLIFVLRDALLIHAVGLAWPGPRTDAITAVAIAASYALLPGLFDQAGLGAAGALFRPGPGDAAWTAAAALAEAGLAAVFLAATVARVTRD